jgi:hypothetical protein
MTTSIQTAPSAMTEAERLAREHLRIFAVGDKAAAAANVSLDYVNLRSLQHLAQWLTRSVEHWRPEGVATNSGFPRSESAERPKPVRCCRKGQEARQRI